MPTRLSDRQKARLEDLRRSLKETRPTKFLDLGCEHGHAGKVALDEGANDIVGVDAWSPYVRALQVSPSCPYTRLKCLDLTLLSVPSLRRIMSDAEFVYCGEVLEHVGSPATLICTITDAWPGARIEFTFPAVAIAQEAIDGNPWQRHVSDPNEFRALLTRLGYSMTVHDTEHNYVVWAKK